MTPSTDGAGDPAIIRARLQAAATQFNTVVAAGKKRALRDAATEAHREVFSAINALRAARPQDAGLIAEAEALLMDIRWGRATTRFM